jgi:polysaccharide pyruvyl transferase WcaK-like protein
LLNRKAAVSLSRDKATYEYITSLGVDNFLAGCPTLFINEIPQHLVPLLDSDKTDALISIRNPSLMSVPVSFQYQMREDLLETVSLLQRSGYTKIKILCHDHRDIPFADSLNIDYLYTEDVFTYLSYLRNTKLNITYRLHAFIPCLAFDIPTINISYDQRSISMLETIGVSNWNINMLTDNVTEKIKDRIKNLSELELLKKQARATVWEGLKHAMLGGCETFAKFVREKSYGKN